MGVPFTRTYIRKAYGFDEEDLAEGWEGTAQNRPEPTAGPAFAEPKPALDSDQAQNSAQDAVDLLAKALVPEELQAQAEALVEPLKRLIEGAASYEEILESLAGQYPAMDDTALTDMLAKLLFVADLWGRAHA